MTRRTSLNLPPIMPLEEWRKIGDQIQVIAESSTWWLGDWLLYGQSQYPDRYMRAIEQTCLDYQTLRNYAWVARRYTVKRRRHGVSFQHHAEVASLSDAEQDEWLNRVEKFGWSRNELRNRLRASRRAARALTEPESDHPVASIEVSIPLDRKQRWAAAASSASQDLGSWMIAILDDAAASVQTPIEAPAERRAA